MAVLKFKDRATGTWLPLNTVTVTKSGVDVIDVIAKLSAEVEGLKTRIANLEASSGRSEI